jgi:hypothetical protein
VVVTNLTNYFISINYPQIFLVALAVIAGILFYAYSISGIVSFLLFLFISLLLHAFSSDKKELARRLLLLFFCSLGYLWGNFWSNHLTYKHQNLHRILSGKPIALQGIVLEITENPTQRYQQSLLVQLETVAKEGKEAFKLHHKAKIFLKRPLSVEIKDHITLKNIFPSNDPTLYSLREDILITSFINKPNFIIRQTTVPLFTKLSCFCTKVRNTLASKLKNKMSPENYSLFSSLFLGAPIEDTQEMGFIKQHFNEWGIAHYLARSGLHVLIMLILWQSLMKVIPVGYRVKNVFLMLILGICAALSWSSVSFTRALVSYFLAKFFLMGGFPTQAITIIAYACLFVLCFNPFHLFFLNFQLSFSLALALAWLGEIDVQKRRSLLYGQ